VINDEFCECRFFEVWDARGGVPYGVDGSFIVLDENAIKKAGMEISAFGFS